MPQKNKIRAEKRFLFWMFRQKKINKKLSRQTENEVKYRRNDYKLNMGETHEVIDKGGKTQEIKNKNTTDKNISK